MNPKQRKDITVAIDEATTYKKLLKKKKESGRTIKNILNLLVTDENLAKI